MAISTTELEDWKSRYDELKSKYEKLQQDYQELQRKAEAAPAEAAPTPVTSPSEFLDTLKRLVARVAMILQAEKCCFLLLDRETGELVGTPPAYGMPDEDVKQIRVKATEGVSGLVFRTGRPAITRQTPSETVPGRKHEEMMPTPIMQAHGLRNGASVPLVIEKRDEENRVIDRTTIGVLHVFNKRYGGEFTDEDLNLLRILSRNAAAVIAQAQLFFEVEEKVKEFEATIESSPFGVLMVNMHGGITQMNASVRKMLGLGTNHIGQPYEKVVTNEKIREAIERILKSGEETSEEITIVHNTDGRTIEQHFQMQTTLVKGDDQQPIGVLVAFNDITEIRNVERMKTAFVSTVSHELRTPMTSIQGFIKTLLDDPEEEYYDKAMRREFYTIIDTECERLKRLINDLLNVSRIERGVALEMNFQPMNLKDLLEKVLKIQSGYTSKHEFKVEIQPGLPDIVADVDKIDQVLTNLINNAIKYSPDGGTITIKVTYDDQGVTVSVADQGLGIPKDQLHKIFQKFQRVDTNDRRSIPGTGIGLFLVKDFVERHGGKIWVESEYGKGSTFSFRLPFEPPQQEEETAQPSS